jgi:polysaccharide export outer membrane protein
VPEYRLRVDDEISFVYRITRDVTPQPYELNVGDRIRVESLQDNNLDRELVIQPDGTITLRLLGQVRAAGRTVDELRQYIEQSYLKFYKDPAITVTPLEVNTKLQDLRNTIDNRAGLGGQSITTRVSPDGTVQLPALGSVPAQGLTLDELNIEVDERYLAIVEGIEVTPVLQQRAPRYAYVLGEVNRPGRFELQGPTTAMQAVALAGGWINGGNLRELVVFRRAADWRLIATKLDLRGGLYGKRPVPSDEIWLRDSDIVLVPAAPIKRFDDAVELVFTRGVNEIFFLRWVDIFETARF